MQIRNNQLVDRALDTLGGNVTRQFHFKEGDFFDGGDVTVSVKELTPAEARALGVDPQTCKNRLYCEGKFFNHGFEYHFTLLDCGGANWALKIFESQIAKDSWELSTGTFAKFPSSKEIYERLSTCLEIG